MFSELKIKIANKKDVPPEANDLEVAEINEADLAFGYNYSNAFANLLIKFNKYCSFKFIYNKRCLPGSKNPQRRVPKRI